MPPKRNKLPPAHIKCDPITPGTVIKDVQKREIIVGKEIAQGGFGRICDCSIKGDSNKYIIKLEPGANGPLFVEQMVFMRILIKKDIDEYMARKKLKFLGVPHLVSNGMYENEIRYIVMPKYNACLDDVFKQQGKLSLSNVKNVVLCLLNTLEYIHSREYAHADIKAANLMMEKKNDFSKVTLIDFGLAMKTDKVEDKENKKRAHNGSAFFTSVDAHRGIGPSYRGDIEITAHNILLWLSGSLPWLHLENKPDDIKAMKIKLISNLPSELDRTGIDKESKDFVSKFYQEAQRLGVNEVPNFDYLKELTQQKNASKKVIGKKTVKAKSIEKEDDEVFETVEEPQPKTKKRGKTKEDEEKDVDKPMTKRSKPKKEVEKGAGDIPIPGLSINRAGKDAWKPKDDIPSTSSSKKIVKKNAVDTNTSEKSSEKEVIYPGLSKKRTVNPNGVIPGLNIEQRLTRSMKRKMLEEDAKIMKKPEAGDASMNELSADENDNTL